MNLKNCLNWKVGGGLGVVALGIVVLAPNLIGRALPLLLLAACPLSMLVMMIGMGKMQGGKSNSPPAHDVTTDESSAPVLVPARTQQTTYGQVEQPNVTALKAQAAGLAARQEQLARDIARLEANDALKERV